MKKLLLTICAALLLIAGCGESSQSEAIETLNTSIKIQVNDKTFTATLEDNPSARAFVEMLPLEIDMTELNGNEKYFYLNSDLPSAPTNVKQIHAGDLMLFGSNCLVLFYKDFTTPYGYTRLGKLDNPADLAKTLGNGNVRIKFEE